jgi:putative oxidoreductase
MLAEYRIAWHKQTAIGNLRIKKTISQSAKLGDNTCMKKLITLGFLPQSYDLALLVLRVWVGLSLFLRHGVEKIANFSDMASHFPDPIHIGPHWTLVIALFSDAVCSILVILGFATRLAALYIVLIVGSAFALVHHFALSGPHSGELPYVYVGVALAIFLAGPGRFSLDGRNVKSGKSR